MPEEIGLHSLKPNPGSRHRRKRVGRGEGSGMGKTSGRGHKGAGSRSGATVRPGFEGGQNPIYMRLGKQRGPYSKDAMPIGPHRTKVQSVNVRDLERFDGEVTPEALKEAGLIRNTRTDLKILGHGDLTKKLTVSAHLFSASAREKIEQAGGTITWLRGEPKPKPKKVRRKPNPAAKKDAEPADAPDEETGAAEEPSVEPEAEAEDSQG